MIDTAATATPPDAEIVALLSKLAIPITRITSDSRKLRQGDAFAAYRGSHDDGRRFIAEAIVRGAGAILWDPDGFSWRREWRLPHLAVENLKARLGNIADVIYGHPSRDLWVVGVTGTNGKTSCVHWIAAGLDAVGKRGAVLGTLGNGLWGSLGTATHTTPDAAELHELLRAFMNQGAEAVAIEVSSHGLDQGRVNGVAFDVALFTNLSRDHLDYHGSMAAYAAAKAKLFAWPGLRVGVVNADDAFGQSLIDSARVAGRKILTYGFGAADIGGSRLTATSLGLAFTVETPWGKGEIYSRLIGAFNAANLLGCLSVLLVSGVALETALAFLAGVDAPTGRMQRLGGDGAPLVVIDYAHTPDALDKVLTSLRSAVTGSGELVCVFGCGGDRDRGKRPEMGRVAARLADRVIVTSDNPRNEDPEAIASDIVHGIRDTGNRRYAVDLDRASAIATAIGEAQVGDVVLVAGKGHEPYQERAGVRFPFLDADHATHALAKRVSP